ncbi:MAG: hypothetical protein SGPRY_005545 [Prymnesium sp.]
MWRCEFGSAHLVDLFQRISSFVMVVAHARIVAYDAAHPHGAARREWQRQRRRAVGSGACTFTDINLDDGFVGLTCAEGEPLRGVTLPKGTAHCKNFREVTAALLLGRCHSSGSSGFRGTASRVKVVSAKSPCRYGGSRGDLYGRSGCVSSGHDGEEEARLTRSAGRDSPHSSQSAREWRPTDRSSQRKAV